jgi:hypothetical protein
MPIDEGIDRAAGPYEAAHGRFAEGKLSKVSSQRARDLLVRADLSEDSAQQFLAVLNMTSSFAMSQRAPDPRAASPPFGKTEGPTGPYAAPGIRIRYQRVADPKPLCDRGAADAGR